MAQNGDARQSSAVWNGNPPAHAPFDSWVTKYGEDAYKDFTKDHPKTDLSYEAWRQTDRVYGGYLYHVASLVWNEDGESDEETPKRRRISRVPGENLRKTATNGTGTPRLSGTATPASAAISDEISASGKRKRKPRKKYMSQELVASDEEAVNEDDVATPKAGVGVSATPEITVNGRRKSASRKPRKKPISDEKISPEDEDDDPMELDSPVMASQLPVRSAPQIETPKKATPKQASVKKSRKSLLVRLPFSLWDDLNLGEKSGETALEGNTNAPAAKTKTTRNNDVGANSDAAETGTAEGTPDPSGAGSRRGLRNRKPAQQRPYYHDAQVFEDVETEPDHDLSDTPLLSRSPSPEVPLQSRPKHFKGKGRAWKKEGSDEDEEFVTPKEKKTAKAARLKAEKEKARSENGKVDASEGDITSALWEALTSETPGSLKSKDKEHDQARKTNGSLSEPPKQKKKIGRPKKSSLSGDAVRDGTGNDPQPPRRGRGRPRKSALSSELVHDDSDDDDAPTAAETQPPLPKVVENPTPNDLAPSSTKNSSRPSTATSTVPASTPKKRGRPRKSDLNTTPVQQPSSKAAADEDTKPAQPASPTATDAADPKPTRTSAPDTSIAAERLPPPATAPATVPAAPPAAAAASDADFPTPAANRGAALVESLYPRDHRVQSGSSRASSSATPVPATTTNPTTTATAPAAAAASTRPPMFAFAAAAASLAAAAAATVAELNALSDSESESESDIGSEVEAESGSDEELVPQDYSSSSPAEMRSRGESFSLGWEGSAVGGEEQEKEGEEGEVKEQEVKEEEGDEEGELSAAMSLSDDSEL